MMVWAPECALVSLTLSQKHRPMLADCAHGSNLAFLIPHHNDRLINYMRREKITGFGNIGFSAQTEPLMIKENAISASLTVNG